MATFLEKTPTIALAILESQKQRITPTIMFVAEKAYNVKNKNKACY